MTEDEYDAFWSPLDALAPGETVRIEPEKAKRRFGERAHAEASARVACRARGIKAVITTVAQGHEGFGIQIRRVS